MKKIIKQEQWVMLPTEDKSPIGYHFDVKIEGEITYAPNHGFELYNKDNNFQHKPQHLYLTSDDEIKGGKEVYYIDKFTNKVTSSGGAEYGENQNVIIATTDKSLKVDTDLEDRVDVLYNNKLPQIPESFIKYYIEKQGKVGDVETLYNFTGITISGENEIIIKLPKEKMYSRDEVEKECRLAFIAGFSVPSTKIGIDKWIKENL